jgi:rod shape-determining protein MreC
VTATPKALLDRNRELMIVWSDSTPIPLSPKPAPNEQENPTHEGQ